MVYFIRDPSTGFVKIGLSDDPPSRLQQLRQEHGKGLYIEFLRSGGRSEETRLHREFKDIRVKGEWFLWDDDMKKLAEKSLDSVVKQKTRCSIISIKKDLHDRMKEKAKAAKVSLQSWILEAVRQRIDEEKNDGIETDGDPHQY